MRDIDRPLTESGTRDARAMGALMRKAGHRPGGVLCSPAVRARQTWQCVAEELGVDGISSRIVPALYEGNAQTYLDVARDGATGDSVLLVGHNPIMEDLGTALPASGDRPSMQAIARGFPTCGLAIIDFSDDPDEIAPGCGTLVDFIVPPRS